MSTDTIIDKKTKTVNKVKEPSKYKVIICNDDTTPVEFVILMLTSVFRLNVEEATKLTLKVHHEGSAIAGIFRYEIAEQKAIDATNLARDNGYPLIIKVEHE